MELKLVRQEKGVRVYEYRKNKDSEKILLPSSIFIWSVEEYSEIQKEMERLNTIEKEKWAKKMRGEVTK